MTTATLERQVSLADYVQLIVIETNQILRALATAGTAINQDALTGKPNGPARSAAGVLVSDLVYCDDSSEKGRLMIRFFGAVAGGESDAAIARVARSLVGVLVDQEAKSNAGALAAGENKTVRFLAGGAA